MSNVLNVAEKPSMAKTIANLLSNNQLTKRPGLNKYCNNFDFFLYSNSHQQRYHMTMTSVLGHCMSIDFPEECSSWRDFPIDNLFDIRIVRSVSKDMSSVAKNLEKEAKASNILVIWTDCDREGENIGKEIQEICLNANRNLRVFRARFSVVNAEELRRAFETWSLLDHQMAEAVDARMELDLRIGAAFTRLQTNLLREIHKLEKTVVSYGSCQFPTLGFVVEQYILRQEFIPEVFWYLSAVVKKDHCNVNFTWARGAFYDEQVTKIYFSLCEPNDAIITQVDTSPTSKWRPLPLTTVEYQKFGSRVLKIDSHQLMTIAEALYNKGIISYPRTETDQFEPGFDLKSLIESQKQHPDWGEFADELLAQQPIRPRKGKNNDKAHPPIHPTKCVADLAGNEKKVYEFICRRFLACCSKIEIEDAKGQKTSVTLKKGDEFFTAGGTIVEELNYLKVYIYEKWSDSVLPEFVQGEKVKCKITVNSGKTSAPALLTEADLITTMDKNGIGTDATIHEHIKKIQDRNYAVKKKGSFEPTDLGLGLVNAYDGLNIFPCLTKPRLRAKMEVDMRKICQGIASKEQIVSENITIYRQIFVKLNEHIDEFKAKVQLSVGNEMTIAQGGDVMGNQILCHCGIDAMQQVVSKDGRNKGRKFYCCSKGVKDPCKCQFFAWEDDIGTGGNNARSANRPVLQEQIQQAPKCDCQIDSVQKTVSKEGPNKGRKFYGCSKGTESRCQFFQWADDNSHHQVITNSHHQNSRNGAENLQAIQPNPSPKCDCQIDAVQKTVSKEGQNKGRKFYGCSKGAESRCQFFQWVDDVVMPVNNLARFNHAQVFEANESPKCDCQIDSIQRTVSKEGPNKGRKFYACPKGAESRCQFFQWADENSSGNSRRNDSSGTSSRGNSSRTGTRNDRYPNQGKPPMCNCNKEAVQKTVSKEGQNKGRGFYCCPKDFRDESKCQFFLWADEVVTGRRPRSSSSYGETSRRPRLD